jgi:hypothetical protein
MDAMNDNTAYPVRKALAFTDEQWRAVRAYRFKHEIDTEADAVRRLIDLGLAAARSFDNGARKKSEAPK